MFDGTRPYATCVNDASLISSDSSLLIAVYRGLWNDRDVELRVDVDSFARARGLTSKQALRALEEAQAQVEDRPYAWVSIPDDVEGDDLQAAHTWIATRADQILVEDQISPGCTVWFEGLCQRWPWKQLLITRKIGELYESNAPACEQNSK